MNVEMKMAVSSSGVPVAVGGTAAAVKVGIVQDGGIGMNAAPLSASAPVSAGCIDAAIQAGIGAAYYATEGEYYDGAYNVTPTDHEQILQTANKIMARNVVVAPIPSNYGKISYNGSTITVS